MSTYSLPYSSLLPRSRHTYFSDFSIYPIEVHEVHDIHGQPLSIPGYE